jgi:hypothetical protein
MTRKEEAMTKIHSVTVPALLFFAIAVATTIVSTSFAFAEGWGRLTSISQMSTRTSAQPSAPTSVPSQANPQTLPVKTR